MPRKFEHNVSGPPTVGQNLQRRVEQNVLEPPKAVLGLPWRVGQDVLKTNVGQNLPRVFETNGSQNLPTKVGQDVKPNVVLGLRL